MADLDLKSISKTYHVHTFYPWYKGWRYDSKNGQNSFIQNLVSTLQENPQILHMLHILEANIYLCRDLGRTHLKDAVLYGNAASSPAICDPFRGEIFLGREYYPNGKIPVQTTAPGFVVAHELAHVLDSRLGKYIDRYDESAPAPATMVDFYANSALNKDNSVEPDMQSQFKVRAGLLGENEEYRSSATEIICDLIAHEWSGHAPDTYRDLAHRYPALQDVAKTMRLAAISVAHRSLYRKMADRFEPLLNIQGSLRTLGSQDSEIPPDGPTFSKP